MSWLTDVNTNVGNFILYQPSSTDVWRATKIENTTASNAFSILVEPSGRNLSKISLDYQLTHKFSMPEINKLPNIEVLRREKHFRFASKKSQ